MSTYEATPIRAHCLRLLPGDDLLLSLRQFCARYSIEAAVILTVVGSTSTTVLRPAGRNEQLVFEEDAEIVSLTGMLADGNEHLHMSISLADCSMRGGHMLEGCIVRTTAEIAIGVLKNVSFRRMLDPRTGFQELTIDPHYAPLLENEALDEEEEPAAEGSTDERHIKFVRKTRPPPPRR